jgi:hypothetical protein
MEESEEDHELFLKKLARENANSVVESEQQNDEVPVSKWFIPCPFCNTS